MFQTHIDKEEGWPLRGKCSSGEKACKADRVKLLPRFLIVQQDGIRREFW